MFSAQDHQEAAHPSPVNMLKKTSNNLRHRRRPTKSDRKNRILDKLTG